MKNPCRSLTAVSLILLLLCLPAFFAWAEEEDYEPQNIYEWGDPGYIEFVAQYAEDAERYSPDGYQRLLELYDPRQPIPFSDLRSANGSGMGANGYLSISGEVLVDPVWYSVSRFEGRYGLALRSGQELVFDRDGHVRLDATEMLFDSLWTDRNRYCYLVGYGPQKLTTALYNEDLFKVADHVESTCSGYYVVRDGSASKLFNYDQELIYQNDSGGDSLRPFLNKVDNQYYLVERKSLSVVILTLPGLKEIARFDRAAASVDAEDCAVEITPMDGDYHNKQLVVLCGNQGARILRLTGSGFVCTMLDADRVRIDYRSFTSYDEVEDDVSLVYSVSRDIAMPADNNRMWLESIMNQEEIREYHQAEAAGLPTFDFPFSGHEDYDLCVGLDYSFSSRLRDFNRTVYHCFLRGDEDIGGCDVLLRDQYTGEEFAFDDVICTWGPTAFFQINEHHYWDSRTLLFEKADGSWTVFDLITQSSYDCPFTYTLESAGRNYLLFSEISPADGVLIRHLYTPTGWSADFSAPILFPESLSYGGVTRPDEALIRASVPTISMTCGHQEPLPARATGYPVSIAGDSPLDWVNAYTNFLKDYRFLIDDYGTSMVKDYYVEPVTPDNILHGEDYPRPFEISVYDLDWDGVPELFLDTGGDFSFGSVFVYTYSKSTVRYAGAIDYHEEKDLGFYSSAEHTGLLNISDARDVVHYTYYDLDKGRLRVQEMYDEVLNEPDSIFVCTEGPKIEWKTDDQEMRDLLMTKTRHPLRFETLYTAVRQGFFEYVVRPIARDTAWDLVRNVPDAASVQGYSYTTSLPDDWAAIQMWLSLFQLDISGMDSAKARRQLYFEFALKACGTMEETSYIRAEKISPELKKLKKGSDLYLDVLYDQVAKITPQNMIISWHGAKADDIKKVMREYIKSDNMSDMELKSRLSSVNIFTSKQQAPVFKSLRTIKLIDDYGKGVKYYEMSESAINHFLEAVNQWNMMDAVDQDQLREIAESFSSRGDPDMKNVGEKIMRFLNCTRGEQLAMLMGNQFADFGFDQLFKKFKSKVLAKAGGMSGSVAALIYMTIDDLTGVGSLTECNIEIVAAGDNMRQFWNDYYNRVGFYGADGNDNTFRRMMYACLNFYAAAVKVNDTYRDLVKTGDEAILRNVVNNDAMRLAAAKAAKDNENYLALIRRIRFLLDLYFII